MGFGEIGKAIQWNQQSTPGHKFGVTAYLIMHAGTSSLEPVKSVQRDPIWYLHGEVVAVSQPTPHLAGTLGNAQVASSNGDLAPNAKLTVKVEVFPDGTLYVQQLLNGTPVGGMPPRKLQATDLNDNLIAALDGIEVWTVGVARMPDVMIDLCEPYRQEAKDLEAQIVEIQTSPEYRQGPDGPNPGRPDPELLKEVQHLQAQEKKALDQWHACKLQDPMNRPNLDATLTGTAKLTIPGMISDSKAVSVGVRFHEFDHKVVEITSFPTLVIGPFPVPGGTNTTTITLLSSANGTCDPSSGFLQLPIALHFHESNLLAGDSDMFGTLSTDAAGGSRIDASGNITIANSVTFKGGTLDKKTGTLVVTGKLSALP